MISFAGIVPHPPLLIPAVGKDKIKQLEETKKGMEDIAKKIADANLDILIIISASHKMHTDAFGILLAPKYTTNFKEFGDFETHNEVLPDLEIIEKIRHSAIDKNIPFTLIHEENIDYTFGVPIHFLISGEKTKVIPIVTSHLDIKSHYELGRIIKTVITNSNKRIGIIASGSLSHKSTSNSPSGFSPKGLEFNEKIKELLETKNTAGLLTLDQKLIKDANESIISSLALLMGVMEKANYKTQIFSYEAPLGVGYIVANLKLL